MPPTTRLLMLRIIGLDMTLENAGNMANPRDAVIEWIDHILQRKNWNGTDLARKADLAPSTILRLMNDPKHQYIPTLKTLQKIAEASGYPIPRKVSEAMGAGSMEAPEVPEDAPSGRRSRQYRALSVEVRYISSLPAAIQAPSNNKRESFVPAIPQLDGDDTLFACYMPDDTLEPWIKAGSLLFASKRRDPVLGDIVIVIDKEGRSRVRALASINSNGLKLSKTMPMKPDEEIGFDKVSELAIVLAVVRT